MDYSLETEQASLGSCLIDKTALDTTFETMKINDYYSTNHQIIFRNIIELVRLNSVVDMITLPVYLQDKNLLEKIGGVTYLTHLINSVPTPANIENYNLIIKKHSNMRKTLFTLEKLKAGKIDTTQALEMINRIPIVEINEEDLKTLLKNTLLVSGNGVAHKFKITALNTYLGGVDKGEIITIGGFTSQGKTSFAIQLAIDFIDGGEGKKVLYCTSEMTPLETSRRILANSMPKNLMEFRKGNFETGDKEALESIANIIGDTWQLNIKKVFDVEDIKKYIRKYSPDIVFVDYLQNLDRRGARSDYERVTGNIKDLQGITLEKEITTFVLSQLSRNKEEIREPKLTDLRDSGRIEECSNIVMLVYWENRMKQENQMRKGGEAPEQIQVRIVKNRDGTIGKITLDFEPEYSRVKEGEYEEYYHEISE
jgi:replicative DNA helicase